MSQTFSASHLKRMAEELLDGREFFISAVLHRVNEAVNAFPHDGAIRTTQLILEKRGAKSGSLGTISQREFQDIYRDVNGLGNKVAFRDMLGDLLFEEAIGSTAHYNNDFVSGLRGDADNQISMVDPNLTEELSGLFDNATNKVASGSFIDNGRKGVKIELESMGFNSSVDVVDKNDKFVIYAATFDTKKGSASILIPAEIKMGTVLMPSVFVSGRGLESLTKDKLLIHVEASQTDLHPRKVLEMLTQATGEVNQPLIYSDSDVMLSAPALLQNLDDTDYSFISTKADVETPPALMHFTEMMARDVLSEAGLNVDPMLVARAKSIVAEELRGFGIPCRKVIVASEFAGGLTIAAQVSGPGGNKTIEVPVEIMGSQILMPSVFTSGVLAKPFDQENLRAFAMNRDEGTFSAQISDKNCLSFRDLHQLVLKSAAYGNFVEAEEALAVIAENYGDQYHKATFDDLMGVLDVGFGKEAKPTSMEVFIKNAVERARDHESNIKMTSNLMYLHPED